MAENCGATLQNQAQTDTPCRCAPQDDLEAVRHFQPGILLDTKNLTRDDVLLSGWVGLARGHSCGDELIGVLLPGDRLGGVLEERLCCAVALTDIALATEKDGTDPGREHQHLIRQCIRTCHYAALDRVEDFFVETYERLEAVELACDWTFDFPLSQATLANILGLSTAHVNRVIKQLQAEYRIEIAGRSVTLLNRRSANALSPRLAL
jgi:CRP-like cAMP-binding protein